MNISVLIFPFLLISLMNGIPVSVCLVVTVYNFLFIRSMLIYNAIKNVYS